MSYIFQSGTSADIIELITSVMAHPEDIDEKDREWAFMALDFIEAFIPVMVWKRDNQNVYLDAAALYGAMRFRNVIDLVSSVAIPQDILKPLKMYLENLHGFSEMTVHDDNNENFRVVWQQHAFRTMQLHHPLSYLNGDPLDFKS